jgi:hypothetical protein
MANELNILPLIKQVLKIKFTAMQTVRIVQAVALMLIMALAASCAASKEYTSKIFAPRTEQKFKDSVAVALKFLEMDSLRQDGDGWVSTDIIMGRDTASNTAALDNLAKVFPARKQVTDSAAPEIKSVESITASKTVTAPTGEVPVAKNITIGPFRNKKTRTDKP